MNDDYAPGLLLLALLAVAAVMVATAVLPLFDQTAAAWQRLAGF